MGAIETRIEKQKTTLELHDEAMVVSKNIKTEYLRLFEILLAIESRRGYQEFDIISLKIYCVELLGLSNSIANDFVIVVRKALEIPQIADALRSGKTTISKIRKICSVVNELNYRDWIELAIHCSAREIERTVALANPRESVPETMTYVAGALLEFKVGVNEEWAELLQKTKDRLSQRERRPVSSEEALFIVMAESHQRNDPLEKAKRAKGRQEKRASFGGNGDKKTSDVSEKSASRPRYRPAAVEHEVDLRDGGQCTHVDSNGKRCGERRWLQKHHLVEFAAGGEHTPENLVTLCSGHHKIAHLRIVPLVT